MHFDNSFLPIFHLSLSFSVSLAAIADTKSRFPSAGYHFNNTFDLSIIPPPLLFETNNKKAISQCMSPSVLAILIIANTYVESQEKQIWRTSLCFYTAFLSFQHHSICMLQMCLTVPAVIGCFRLRDFTWAETQHSAAFDGGKREIKSTEIKSQELLPPHNNYCTPAINI